MSTALPNVVCQIDGTWYARRIVARVVAPLSRRSVADECALNEMRWHGASNDSVVVEIGLPQAVGRSVSRVPLVTRRYQYFVLTFYLSIMRC
jgi:hypothetical protein